MPLRNHGVRVAIVATMALLAGACHYNNWSSLRGDNAGTASNNDSHNITVSQAGALTEQKNVQIGSVPSLGTNVLFQSGPIEVNGNVYVNGDDGYLHAFGEDKLNNLWNARTAGSAALENPTPSAVTAIGSTPART
ncbi:MAG TPA: hypothetical protein VFR41_00865, partial [Acidimicrobiia bacterium]|nr:hypothetical protein [Acidimicrobiia bacterium]